MNDQYHNTDSSLGRFSCRALLREITNRIDDWETGKCNSETLSEDSCLRQYRLRKLSRELASRFRPWEDVLKDANKNGNPDMFSATSVADDVPTFRSVLEFEEWGESIMRMDIPLLLGSNMAGKPAIQDLRQVQHLLVCGMQGSGICEVLHTVLMNFMLVFAPSELQVILIDSARKEFSCYHDLEHLLVPVIEDPAQALLVLQEAAAEVETRCQLLAAAQVADISTYNENFYINMLSEKKRKEYSVPMPYRVIILDELADLMYVDRDTANQATEALLKIARDGGKSGVHLILASRRPSRNTLDNKLTTAIPGRIALRMGSYVDSQVILGENGAETLTGHGDMLFRASSSAPLQPIQGFHPKHEEVEKVVDFVATQNEPEYW